MQLIITGIREEAPGVRTLTLSRGDGGEISYVAGQFLSFDFGEGLHTRRRSYSLSTTPGIDPVPAITVKRIPNGLMSRWLCDTAMPGDILDSTGEATGLFTLPQSTESYDAIWLFAAGIGITPIWSILKDALHHRALPVVLVYSNPGKAQTTFYQEITEQERAFGPMLRIAWLWSDAKNLGRARLSTESFPWLRQDYLTQNPARILSYICGPERYMWMLQMLLEGAGVPADNIRRELFQINREARALQPPVDRDLHEVTIIRGGAPYTFQAAYPDSILRAARASGLPMPFSCETGQCGSCAARCLSGKVWMSYNEVLTDGDLKAGLVLTCTGHAVGGPVVLQL